MKADTPTPPQPALKAPAEPALRKHRWQAANIAPFVSLLVPILIFGLLVEDFLSLGKLTLVLQQGSVLAIAAVGLTFVLLCGEIDLSVGMMALWTASLCGVLFAQATAGKEEAAILAMGMSPAVLIVPLLAALALGVLSGYFTVSSRLPSFIITLAMLNITYGASKFITHSEPFKMPVLLNRIGNDRIPILKDSLYLPYSTILATVVIVLGHLVLTHTRFGRGVYMTGGNRDAARLAGIRTERVVIASLAISAVCAGLAGLVNAGRLESVTQDQNADLLLDAVACVVLGGTSLFGGEGSILRTVLGVLTYTVLKVGLAGIKISKWKGLTESLDRLTENVPILQPFLGGLESHFDLLRPFVLGVVLLIALVINGHLSKRRG